MRNPTLFRHVTPIPPAAVYPRRPCPANPSNYVIHIVTGVREKGARWEEATVKSFCSAAGDTGKPHLLTRVFLLLNGEWRVGGES